MSVAPSFSSRNVREALGPTLRFRTKGKLLARIEENPAEIVAFCPDENEKDALIASRWLNA